MFDRFVGSVKAKEQAERELIALALGGAHPLDNPDAVWLDQDGNLWLPEEFAPTHRFNVIEFLRRNAEGVFYAYDLDEGAKLLAFDAIGGYVPDELLLPDEIYGSHIPDDFVKWIEAKPYFKRLVELHEQWESDGNFADVANA